MNLFVWGPLKNHGLLSFILRRTYNSKFEPCQLYGYMVGTNFKDRLFFVGGSHPDLMIEGYIAHELSTTDFVKLDRFFAVGSELHDRRLHTVKVLRDSKITDAQVYVYSAGKQFSKISGEEIFAWPYS